MISRLEPYRDYRDDASWLGRIPKHWHVRRLKYLLREVDDRSTSGNEQLLRVSQYTGVTERKNRGDEPDTRAESLVGYKVVKPNDLAINIMLAWNGSLGVSNYAGIVSPAYCVYRFRLDAVPHYFHDLLRSTQYKTRIKAMSRGVVESRLRLYSDDLYRIEVHLPPVEEQNAIVRFLHHTDRKFALYIRAKQRLIKLLEEQKRAITHTRVTRGLNPNVRLKPSGVEWLGEVPEHWELSRVKSEFICLNRHRVPLSSTVRGEMTLRAYDYYGASGVIDKVDNYLYDDELLLIAEDGANLVLRNLPLAIIARGKFWVNNHAHIIKPRRGAIEYLASMMEGLNYLPWISGAAQPKLTKDRLMGIPIAVPPADEQEKIILASSQETAPLVRTIARAKREVELLKEFRTHLVCDVVTGRLDVRAAAATLPEPMQASNVIENGDVLDDSHADDVEDVETEEVAA